MSAAAASSAAAAAAAATAAAAAAAAADATLHGKHLRAAPPGGAQGLAMANAAEREVEEGERPQLRAPAERGWLVSVGRPGRLRKRVAEQ